MVTGKLGLIAGVLMLFASCKNSGSLEGKWQYAGGIYNGKAEGGTDGYQLQRNYTGKNFEEEASPKNTKLAIMPYPVIAVWKPKPLAPNHPNLPA
jgi:hypothetical protein